MESKSKNLIKNILASLDIKINGKRPWDIKVLNENIYQRVLKDGMLGVGGGVYGRGVGLREIG